MSASADVTFAGLEHAFVNDRRSLWALCYRMTGSAADAEDLVQATFERALTQPPSDTARPWRPWLFRVAINLARDHLRARKRQVYRGPWLPEPVHTDSVVSELQRYLPEPRVEPLDTEKRYDLIESLGYAFLVSLEALSPTQRAVLLLRDVLEYSARETGEALDLSEANVRTTHLRARRAMAAYDADPVRPDPQLSERTRELTSRFLLYMAARDVDGLRSLLSQDVIALNDGAGVYAAAGVPLYGPDRVARFQVGITKGAAVAPQVAWCRMNGMPAVVVEFDPRALKPRRAPRTLLLPRPGADGLISGVYMVVAPDKLRATPGVAEARARFSQ